MIETTDLNSVPQTSTQTPEPTPHGPFAALRNALPATEVILFLVVGGFNTAFSIGLAYLLIHPVEYLFPKLPLAADTTIANYVSLPVSITVAFLGYKWFVFRTHGNYIKEWMKVFAVYGVSLPFPFIIIPLATTVFLHFSMPHKLASLAALIVNSGAIACYSYFAHKKFSFKR
jgi:putative flippase GtrA